MILFVLSEAGAEKEDMEFFANLIDWYLKIWVFFWGYGHIKRIVGNIFKHNKGE